MPRLKVSTDSLEVNGDQAVLSWTVKAEYGGAEYPQAKGKTIKTWGTSFYTIANGKIVEERGLKQTSDTGAIEAVIAAVLEKNPAQLEQYRGGKVALFGFFVGQTMKAMGGKANPGVVNELLKKALG